MIFLDNASTTQLSEKAVKNLVEYNTEKFYNPSSSYSVGYQNSKDIEEVKKLICKNLNVQYNNNIIFTGSATEATNLAIFGSYRPSFKKMIFSAGEHPSVYQTALAFKEKGVQVEFVNLQKNGEIDYNELEQILDENVNFISIMQVSNETGAINDIKRVIDIKNRKCPNAIVHCDGVQAFGKIETDLQKMPVGFYTISAHKFHGPKGLGALYAKNPNRLKPQVFGGGQEFGLRSGTENLASIMALKTAIEEIGDISKKLTQLRKINKQFKETFLKKLLSDIKVKFIQNDNLSPYIINFSISEIKGEVLQYMCDAKGLLISTGSACSSKKSGNRILGNMCYSKKEIVGNIRVSFSALTTENDAAKGAEILAECANELWSKTK